MVECHASDLIARVQFPLPAPTTFLFEPIEQIDTKIIQKMDEYLTEVKQEQKERFEKRDKEKEIQQFYEKMKMAEQYKKPQAEKLTIQKH